MIVITGKLKQIALSIILLYRLSSCTRPMRTKDGLFYFSEAQDTFGMSGEPVEATAPKAPATHSALAASSAVFSPTKPNPNGTRRKLSNPIKVEKGNNRIATTSYSDPLPRRHAQSSSEDVNPLSRSLPINIPGIDVTSPRERPKSPPLINPKEQFDKNEIYGGNAMHDFHTSHLFPHPPAYRYG